jgi:hypothetical protein
MIKDGIHILLFFWESDPQLKSMPSLPSMGHSEWVTPFPEYIQFT